MNNLRTQSGTQTVAPCPGKRFNGFQKHCLVQLLPCEEEVGIAAMAPVSRRSAYCYNLQARRISGALVALDPVDLAVHHVLEAVRARGARVGRIPLAVIRITILAQRVGNHQTKLVTCKREGG